MFKPLLASPAEDLVFPFYASIKIDGIRCCIRPGCRAMSRNLKPIPNHFIRTMLESDSAIEHCDGEILTFTNGKMDNFNMVQSKVMSADGSPEFKFFIFDHFQNPTEPYSIRRQLIPYGREHTKVVNQIDVHYQTELDALEASAIADGWEGLIVRSMHGHYKYGRSTAKEGILLKVVRKRRAEARVVGTYERLHNANEATFNELGHTQRSSHKDNKIGRDDLGGVDLVWDGCADGQSLADGPIEFSCGTGFDDAQRADLWEKRESLIGRTVTFEFRGIGTNNRPRFPAFIAII